LISNRKPFPVKLYLFILCLCLFSCNKKEFLDERPRSDLFVPATLDDFQALLDNDFAIGFTPVLGELSADNYYLSYSLWQSIGTKEQNAYIWTPDTYNGEGNVSDWNSPYEQILYANVVLDGLAKVARTSDNSQQWDHIKGSALFTRAYSFYNLAQIFALPYNAATANEDLGIPLKLTPNVDESIKRSTIEQTYIQILNDLREAKTLLPDTISSLRIRPNKPAALAQLARVYLSMRQYENAGAYADSSLQLYKALIDYNTRDAVLSRPFDRLNAETMYQSKFVETNVLKGVLGYAAVDSTLYKSYALNDLRRSLFFLVSPAKISFKGSYTGLITAFSGLATDETYLIRAECRARAGDVNGAMDDLNTLLVQRWKTGTFIPFTASTREQAIDTILQERRKEMPCRGVRWTDIRRLNLDDANIKPIRVLNNQVYELLPKSLKYALLIPPDAMVMGSYEQNKR
jgi:starch-binding outer membrane protein, SusD/RagB family